MNDKGGHRAARAAKKVHLSTKIGACFRRIFEINNFLPRTHSKLTELPGMDS